MSLHTLANHLQKAGRGEDKVLVHMTPNEVSGLQALAMANGGSLTTNPQTGLPEAGFLSSILPVLAGVALGPAGLGLSAMQAGLAAGAIGTVATGSLQKGLMAGLGAYGGAGLGGALMGAAPAAAAAAMPTAAVSPAMGAGQMLTSAGLAGSPPALAAQAAAPSAAVGAGQAMTSTGLAGSPATAAPVNLPATGAAPTNINVPSNPFADRLKTMGQNVGRLFGGSEEDAAYRSKFFSENKMPLMATGLAALQAMTPEYEEERRRVLEFDPNYRAYSPGYFEPMYASSRAPGSTAERRFYAKDGGLAKLANGGPVAEMSHLNEVGANTGYPMADQMAPQYAFSAERPVSENVIRPQGDSRIDPYTGEMRLMAGGITDYYARTGGSGQQSTIAPATAKGATAPKANVYTPRYNYRDPVTGEYKSVSVEEETFQPISKLPKLSTQTSRVTEDDVREVYARFGMQPTDAALQKFVGNRASDAAIAKFLKNSKEFKAKKSWTPEEVTDYFRGVFGVDPTPDDLARFSNPRKKFNVAALYKYAQKQPEYLENINKTAEQQFTQQQEQKKEETLQQAREEKPLKVTDIASQFQDILGRPPTFDELQSYKDKPIVAEDLKKQLEGSKEFETKLTKKFIPDIQYDQFGRASIEGLPAYKTPEQQLGLGGFYEMMNQQLAQQGGYQPAPPPPPPMPSRVAPPPEPVLYQPPQPIGQPAPTPAPSASMVMPKTPGSASMIDPVTGLPTPSQPVVMAGGGLSHLGDYSDGGRLLKGPGDGVSDSIPASIGGRQPARLADGEFVIPARIVSEIGNGSTDAGARKLYQMMDRIQNARRKSIGKGKVAVNSKADKHLPA